MGLDQGIYKNGEEVLYLRKANQVHGYMNALSNQLYGRDYDNCENMAIGYATLVELQSICDTLLRAHAEDKGEEYAQWLLPPMPGFFFGSYEFDEWYWDQLRTTRNQLSVIIANHSPNDEYHYWAWW